MNVTRGPLTGTPLVQELPGISLPGRQMRGLAEPDLARRILAEVAALHGVGVPEIAGPRRAPRFIPARQEAMFRLAAETDESLTAIGRLLGGRDHSTVWHGVRAHAQRAALPVPRGISSLDEVKKRPPPKTDRKVPAWTAEEEAALTDIWLLAPALREAALAERLPRRSRSACERMAVRMGIAPPGGDDEARDRRRAARGCARLLELLQLHHGDLPPERR